MVQVQGWARQNHFKGSARVYDAHVSVQGTESIHSPKPTHNLTSSPISMEGLWTKPWKSWSFHHTSQREKSLVFPKSTDRFRPLTWHLHHSHLQLFIKWVNIKFKESSLHKNSYISDLHSDLKTGVRLIELLESIAPITVHYSDDFTHSLLLLTHSDADHIRCKTPSCQERDDSQPEPSSEGHWEAENQNEPCCHRTR